MSYLDAPRLAFAGHFQADVSTVNNDVRYFDNAKFQKKYQDLSLTADDGGWNPEGTAIFRFVDCRITGARLGNQQIVSPAQDCAIGMALENADDRVFGKIVDLDPQQQAVSQVWGMKLRLDGGGEKALFGGEFVPVAFTNLWRRQQTTVLMDQALAAVYQSVLQNVVWQGRSESKVLDALRAASADGFLAINFNVYGYGRDPAIPRYTLGRVRGVIGPYTPNEPKHFVIGRQMVAAGPNPTAPPNRVYSFQCKVHEKRNVVSADFGNCLQIVSADGPFADNGKLLMGVFKGDTDVPLATVTADQVAILGTVDYLRADWYEQTGGVLDFDYSGDPWIVANIASHPLLLLSPQPDKTFKVAVQETLGGFYVRSDSFVCRLNPGEPGCVELFASKYGKRFKGTIAFSDTNGSMGGGAGSQPLDPPVATPEIATPPDAITFPAQLPCDQQGKATLNFTVDLSQSPTPRGYIDGQLYGIAYQLTAQPAQTVSNFWNFVSVLAFSPFQAPKSPTWFADIRPIMTQYGNLYPIMSKHLVDLGDYDSVVRHLKILTLAFSLPIADPNHMPVTRDLSDAKRVMILQWMNSPGADGLPLKGEETAITASAAPLRAAPDPIPLNLDPLQTRGKSEVMLQFQARQEKKERP